MAVLFRLKSHRTRTQWAREWLGDVCCHLGATSWHDLRGSPAQIKAVTTAAFRKSQRSREWQAWGRVLTRQTLPDKADPKRQLTAKRYPKADHPETAPNKTELACLLMQRLQHIRSELDLYIRPLECRWNRFRQQSGSRKSVSGKAGVYRPGRVHSAAIPDPGLRPKLPGAAAVAARFTRALLIDGCLAFWFATRELNGRNCRR